MSRFKELDEKLLAWLLDNLRAGRTAVFGKEQGRAVLRARLGQDGAFSEDTLRSVNRVAGTGKEETRADLVCVPLFGTQRAVVGVLLLQDPYHEEAFSEHEWQFCRRCARWLEVARMGRVSQDLPRISDGKSPGSSKAAQAPNRQVEQQRNSSREQLARPEVFFRSLFTMINAGLTLHESLYFLAESADDEASRRVTTEIADGISGGRRLSAVMSDFPAAFSAYHIGLVKIGENTGSLALVLRITAEHLEKSRNLSQKIKSSLTYPMVLVSGTLLLLTVAPSWLLEGHLEMLKGSEVQLPFLTRALVVWSDFCQSPLFFVLVLALLGLVSMLLRNRQWRTRLLLACHALPGLGKILRTAAAARFARALCISMKAGVGLLEALKLSAQSTGDPLLEKSMEKVHQNLMEGETLAECFTGADILPDGFAQVVAAGEQSGKVIPLLELMADLYDMDVSTAINNLTVLLEPLLLSLIGIFTAIVLMATLQPTILVLQAL